MAVSEYSYGTVALVHDKIGWVIPGRAVFGAATVPTEAEVEAVLDEVANEIHAALLEAGYPASTKAAVLAAAPRAVGWLERLNVAGACADVLQSFAIASDPETGYNPGKFWRTIYENGLKLVRGAFLERMGLTRSHALSELLVSGSLYDTEGNEKDPLFKRGQFDVPGSAVGIFPNEDISYGE